MKSLGLRGGEDWGFAAISTVHLGCRFSFDLSRLIGFFAGWQIVTKGGSVDGTEA